MEFPCDGGILTLQQMITEPNMWRMMLKKPGPVRETAAEEFVGLLVLLVVYIDDLLVLGFPAPVAAVKGCKRNGRHLSQKPLAWRRG